MRTGGRLQAWPGRQPTPVLRFQGFAADRHAAGEHEELQPALAGMSAAGAASAWDMVYVLRR